MAIKIAIDAGHGSNTAGKRTPDGYREHYINVKAAYYCEQYLKVRGIETLRIAWDDTNSTDDTDVALSTRQKQIKNAKCDYSVSFHANAYGDGKTYNSGQGVETLIHNSVLYRKDSQKFAEVIQSQLIKGTSQKNRGVKKQSLAMCNCIAMGVKAACLVEIGFMTNEHEAGLMKTDAFCKEQGEDVARGILNYLGIADKPITNNSTPTTSTTTTKVPFLIKVDKVQKGDVLNIRKEPNANATKTGQLAYNDPNTYTIIEVKNGWGLLKSKLGWINLSYTKTVSRNTSTTTKPTTTPVVKPVVKPVAPTKTLDDWVNEVKAGKHGSGHANREVSLKKAGCPYSYAEVRAKVNASYGVKTTTSTTTKPVTSKKSLDDWAKEVKAGKHGNGHANREKSLKKAGCQYSYSQVRARVNALS